MVKGFFYIWVCYIIIVVKLKNYLGSVVKFIVLVFFYGFIDVNKNIGLIINGRICMFEKIL